MIGNFMNKKGQIKRGIIVLIIIILIAILIYLAFLLTNYNKKSYNGGSKIPDPSMTYCKDNGYTYKIKNTETGEQGFCIFPDNSECDSWSYFCGCTKDKRYCSKEYPACQYVCG